MNDSSHDATWIRLERHLLHEETPAERTATAGWIAEDPVRAALLTDLRRLRRVDEVARVRKDWHVDRMWQELEGRHTQRDSGAYRRLTRECVRRMQDLYVWAAAVLKLKANPAVGRNPAGMAGGATVKKLFRAWPRKGLVPHSFRRTAGLGMALGAAILVAPVLWHWRRDTSIPAAARQELVAREITTRRAQRAEVRLSDGTRILLAPESRLRIPAVAEYEVELDGEAFFDVVHDTTRVFRVHTPFGVAEDIGTSFAVSAYPDARQMSVAMVSGIVGLSRTVRPTAGRDTTVLILTRGDIGWIDTTGRLSVRHDGDITRYVAWTDGRLVLDGLTFAEAIPLLNRWFDLDIRVTDATLGRERLAGAFGGDVSAYHVLQGIASSLFAHVERQGKIVRVTRP